MKEAWQCPGCHTWYAPHINSCDCQRNTEQYMRFVPYIMPVYPYPRYEWPYITWTSSTSSITAKDVASGTLILKPDLAQKYYSTQTGDDTW